MIDKPRRLLVSAIAAVPLVGLALVVGPALRVDDPGASPTALATDVIGELPAGPGIVVATRPAVWSALRYEMQLAGARPDLGLVAPLPLGDAETLAEQALADGRVVGADGFELVYRADHPLHARARGRGFELLATPPPAHRALLPKPARYASAIGGELAIALAIERARYEAAESRLEAAARALGLEQRFGAADLAVLAATVPTHDRPSFYGFVPRLGTEPGSWLYDLFGDDLAWVGGLAQPDVAAPPERRLHALWRRLWRGEIKDSDPAIAALGPAAVEATAKLVAALRH